MLADRDHQNGGRFAAARDIRSAASRDYEVTGGLSEWGAIDALICDALICDALICDALICVEVYRDSRYPVACPVAVAMGSNGDSRASAKAVMLDVLVL